MFPTDHSIAALDEAAPATGVDATMTNPLPRGPVFGWRSLRGQTNATVANVGMLAGQAMTTSGRAAIFHALKLLQMPPRRCGVLVPTYHCPTMVAPAHLAGLPIRFYGLAEDGLPDLQSIDAQATDRCGAILVPHLFGRTLSLAAVRSWCDRHGIALIEDCAHALFGQAGERPVGAWGDYATASLSKFLPVPEGGLLASATRPVPALPLAPRCWQDEAKGWADVAEVSAAHQRLLGLNALLGAAFKAKAVLRGGGPQEPSDTAAAASNCPGTMQMMDECDMARVEGRPLNVTRWMAAHLPRGDIVARRRRNFDSYGRCLDGAHGAHSLAGTGPHGAGWPEAVAPYVFPLWVDEADAVYAQLRRQRVPVFRWDRRWPGTPDAPGDAGRAWSRHVLQLLCHQDLGTSDIEHISQAVRSLLPAR
jgi:dTDP-4-amino-4,6-dideoxygalactose transaminase